MEDTQDLKKIVDDMWSRERLQSQLKHTEENAIYSIRTERELEVGFQDMMNAFVQSKCRGSQTIFTIT